MAIDLDFEGLMSEPDAKHLVQQLSFAYAANKSVATPLHLQFMSFDGAMKERATRQISGGDACACTHPRACMHAGACSQVGQVRGTSTEPFGCALPAGWTGQHHHGHRTAAAKGRRHMST